MKKIQKQDWRMEMKLNKKNKLNKIIKWKWKLKLKKRNKINLLSSFKKRI